MTDRDEAVAIGWTAVIAWRLDRWLRDIQDTVAVFPLKTADDVIDQAPKEIAHWSCFVTGGAGYGAFGTKAAEAIGAKRPCQREPTGEQALAMQELIKQADSKKKPTS